MKQQSHDLKKLNREKKLNNQILIARLIESFNVRNIKKSQIKFQNNFFEIYNESSYIACENYFTFMKNQFRLNNVQNQDDINDAKINFAITYFEITSKFE